MQEQYKVTSEDEISIDVDGAIKTIYSDILNEGFRSIFPKGSLIRELGNSVSLSSISAPGSA